MTSVVYVSTPGPAGNTMWPTSGAPASSLGVNGDFANDVTNSVMYGPKAAGAWPAGVTYKGNGTPGTDGNTIWPTTGVPSTELGVNGDFANDPTNSVMYGPKAGGVWPAGVSYKGPQGVPGAAAKWTPGMTYKGLVATRGKSPSTTMNASVFMSRYPVVARQAISHMGVTIPQWYANGGDFPIGADRTTKCSVEYNGAIVGNITFGGQATGTVYDFSSLESDEITLSATIPSGAIFYIREYSTTTGTTMPLSSFSVLIGANTANGTCFQYGTTGISDLTESPGIFTSTDSYAFVAPVAIWATGVAVPTIAIFGDSRNEGWYDAFATAMDVGETAHTVGATRAYTNLARGLETVGAAVTAGMPQRIAIANAYCSHAYCNYAFNDLFVAGSTPQQILGWLSQLRNQLLGKWFNQTTAMGRTDSTDGWATVQNQTLFSVPVETSRRQLMNCMRHVNGIFDNVYEVAGVLETSLNSGIWKAPGYTGTDNQGIHETPTGYTAIATAGVIVVP